MLAVDSQGGTPQEGQGSVPGQSRCRLVVGIWAVGLEEAVPSATVTMKRHRPSGAPQRLFQATARNPFG